MEEAKRLHREALKQSATDPTSGKIDITILTTGLSSANRRQRANLAQALKELVKSKGKTPTLNYQKLFNELKEQSDIVKKKYFYILFSPALLLCLRFNPFRIFLLQQVTRELFEDVLKDLQDDDIIIVTSRTSIRIC